MNILKLLGLNNISFRQGSSEIIAPKANPKAPKHAQIRTKNSAQQTLFQNIALKCWNDPQTHQDNIEFMGEVWKQHGIVVNVQGLSEAIPEKVKDFILSLPDFFFELDSFHVLDLTGKLPDKAKKKVGGKPWGGDYFFQEKTVYLSPHTLFSENKFPAFKYLLLHEIGHAIIKLWQFHDIFNSPLALAMFPDQMKKCVEIGDEWSAHANTFDQIRQSVAGISNNIFLRNKSGDEKDEIFPVGFATYLMWPELVEQDSTRIKNLFSQENDQMEASAKSYGLDFFSFFKSQFKQEEFALLLAKEEERNLLSTSCSDIWKIPEILFPKATDHLYWAF